MNNLLYLSVNNKMPQSLRLGSISKNQIIMTNLIPSTKVCTKCNVSKPLNQFSNHKGNKDGLSYFCKLCKKKQYQEFHRSKLGLITVIYNSHKQSSKKRGHKPPPYSLLELQNWFSNQKNYNLLYDNWVASNYDIMLTPSCDRTDDYQGYCLSRLTLMTWQENKSKGSRDRKNGVNNKGSKSVIATHIKTGDIIEFYSMIEASRQTGIPFSNISVVASGKPKKDGKGYLYIPKSAGGYSWKFKNLKL